MQLNTDPRVDAYIEQSASFAKPVLQHIRTLVHQAVPEATEAIKWGMPFFEYKGILCNMAAFKNHCSFGFFKAGLMKSAAELQANNESGMGHLGKITSLADLPEDEVLTGYIKEAAALNESGVKKATPKNRPKKKSWSFRVKLQPHCKPMLLQKTPSTISPTAKKKNMWTG